MTTPAATDELVLQDTLRAIRDGLIPPPPSASLLGLEMVDVGDGWSHFALDLRKGHLNVDGTVNGGILAAVVDYAACSAVNIVPLVAVVNTVDLHVSYLKKVAMSATRLEAKGELVRIAGTTAFVRVNVVTENDGDVAIAQVTCRFRRPA